MRDKANAETLTDVKFSSDTNSFSTLIDSIPALVAYIDCNMILQYCNQPFKNWLSLNKVAGESFRPAVGKFIFDQVQRHMGKVLVGHRANFEMVVHTSEGLQFFDTTLSPDYDERKRVKGFVFHCSDVTEKARTERSLKDYFENAAIGLHWVNAEGIITWANPAELAMLGYDADEYIGHHISRFYTDQDVIYDILNRLSRNEALRNYEAILLCKDGSTKDVSINSSVLWEGDKFVHTRCFTVDITDQKRARKALEGSEERFRMMANLVPLVIWTTDRQGNCNFLNVRWEELTGKTVREGLEKHWNHFVHPDDRENIIESWRQSFSRKKPFEGKFRLRNSKGGHDVIYANSLPRYNVSGEFEGYIGILQDISTEDHIRSSLERIVLDRTEDLSKRNVELRAAEKALRFKNEALEKINKQLASFAHIASHDLQEPLRKIQAFSSRLFELEGNRLSDKGRELYNHIHSSSERMRNLIRDLLAYSQSSSDGGRIEATDLNQLFSEVINELELKVIEKNAKIENFGLPTVHVIKFQFHQLFLNLISNALKFSKGGVAPEIVVRSKVVKGSEVLNGLGEVGKSYHHISITDNGVGFELQYSEKIFDMFQRLHSRTDYEGTGIGLAICKKIIENYNGIIIAEGRLKVGSTFHIYLPVGD